MVYGDSFKNCIVAVVVPDGPTVEKWATANKKKGTLAELCNDADLKKDILESMHETAKLNKLSSLEKPQELYLTEEAFSIENNILTPTFKLKRNIARDMYKDQLDQLYVELAKRGK